MLLQKFYKSYLVNIRHCAMWLIFTIHTRRICVVCMKVLVDGLVTSSQKLPTYTTQHTSYIRTYTAKIAHTDIAFLILLVNADEIGTCVLWRIRASKWNAKRRTWELIEQSTLPLPRFDSKENEVREKRAQKYCSSHSHCVCNTGRRQHAHWASLYTLRNWYEWWILAEDEWIPVNKRGLTRHFYVCIWMQCTSNSTLALAFASFSDIRTL